MRPSKVRMTGIWKVIPKAKISVMISDRYSLTRGRSSICACPGLLRLLHGQEEMQQVRHDEEIDDERAEQEEDRRGDEIRREGRALMAIEPPARRRR